MSIANILRTQFIEACARELKLSLNGGPDPKALGRCETTTDAKGNEDRARARDEAKDELDQRDPRQGCKVHGKGVEPIRLSAAEPKSAASASFAIRA